MISEVPPKTQTDLVEEFLPLQELPASNLGEPFSQDALELSDLENLYATVHRWKRDGDKMFNEQPFSKDDVYVYFRDRRRQILTITLRVNSCQD